MQTMRGGEVYRWAARLLLHDGDIHPTLRMLSLAGAFDRFNQTFGCDTTFANQTVTDMCLALCLMADVADDEDRL